jgi:hypothetical protein
MPAIAPPTASFYITGGTLPPDARSYVERQADRDLLAALREGQYARFPSPPMSSSRRSGSATWGEPPSPTCGG